MLKILAMHCRPNWAFIVLIMLAATPVFAKGKEPPKAPASGESREREARKACLAGDYAKGVAILSDLFLDTKQATYIFNQGRCYQQNERFDEAIRCFREYLRTSNDDPATAQKHIAECEAMQQRKNSAAAQNTAPAGPVLAVPATSALPLTSSVVPPAESGNLALISTEATRPEPAPSPMYKTWWFWTGAGALVASGVITAVLLSRGGKSDPFCSDCLGTAGVPTK
jgi:hypothetical protein